MKMNNGELFLFDEKSRLRGATNQHLVIIQPIGMEYYSPIEEGFSTPIDNPFVAGFLKGEFSYSVDAQWDTLFDGVIGSGEGLLNKVGQFTGSPLFQSGLFKRKFYKGGSYISFSLEFRMISDAPYEIDASKNGLLLNPKTAGHFLASLCLPAPDPLGKFVGDTITGKNIPTSIESIKQAGNDLLEKAGDLATKAYPRTCRIKIGNYFESFDMLIDKVTMKYSRQNIYSGHGNARYANPHINENDKAIEVGKDNLTAFQPLFVDFTVDVSTRTIPQTSKYGNGNTGLLSPQPIVTLKSELKQFGGQ